MVAQALSQTNEKAPSVSNDHFKPWNEWFDRRALSNRSDNIPAVNIVEHKDEYRMTLVAPGLKKEDFKIDLESNLLTISAEKSGSKDEKEKKFVHIEYNYSSFHRCFTLPEEIRKEKIEAKYEDGVLHILLPRKESSKNRLSKSIHVK